MRIGTSSSFFRDLSLETTIQNVSGVGYDSLEIWADHLHDQEEDPKSIRIEADRCGIGLTLHAPCYDLNPLSSNPGIRRESVNQLMEALELAADLEAELVVIHPGRFSSSRDTTEIFFPRLVDFSLLMSARATELGVRITLELMEKRSKEFFQTPADAARLMGHTDADFGLTVDIAHFHTLGNEVALIGEMKPEWIQHIHLSDSGPEFTHLPLGQGKVDIAGALAALPSDFTGIINIEGSISGRGKETVLSNIHYLRKIVEKRS